MQQHFDLSTQSTICELKHDEALKVHLKCYICLHNKSNPTSTLGDIFGQGQNDYIIIYGTEVFPFSHLAYHRVPCSVFI